MNDEMNSSQNWVDDHINPINEQVAKRAEEATRKIIGPGQYSQQRYDFVYREQLGIARQDILDELEFERAYKNQRHIGDIENAQRANDNIKNNLEKEKMYRQGSIEAELDHTEEELIRRDTNGIDIKGIVDHYRTVAECYNIMDQNEIHQIIEEALLNPTSLLGGNGSEFPKENEDKLRELFYNSVNNNDEISLSDIEKLIPDEKSKQIIGNLPSNNGKINVSELLSQLVEARIKTSKGYMEVASEDIKARTAGVDMKLSTINNIRDTGTASKKYYEEHNDRMQSRKETLEEESKRYFLEQRDNQRRHDTSVRTQQISAMNISSTQQKEVGKNLDMGERKSR